jgi:NAD(P)H-dependent FMN reductase
MQSVSIIVGSNGNNLKLANTLSQVIKDKEAKCNIIDITMLDLPLYSNNSHKEGVPPCIEEQKAKLEQSTHLIVLAPEYNGGLPPVLTNYFAWMSVSGKDWRESFNGKKAIIGTHSGSGGLHALMALRVQLAYIGVNVMGRQIHTHFKKELNLEATTIQIEQFLG